VREWGSVEMKLVKKFFLSNFNAQLATVTAKRQTPTVNRQLTCPAMFC